jgi:hypothetical protein
VDFLSFVEDRVLEAFQMKAGDHGQSFKRQLLCCFVAAALLALYCSAFEKLTFYIAKIGSYNSVNREFKTYFAKQSSSVRSMYWPPSLDTSSKEMSQNGSTTVETRLQISVRRETNCPMSN